MNANVPNNERIVNKDGSIDTQFLFDFVDSRLIVHCDQLSQTSHNLRTSLVEVIKLDGSKMNVEVPNNVITFPDHLPPCAA